KTTLDSDLLARQATPKVTPVENALRHIRKGGETGFRMSPPFFLKRECDE
ncbi:MAG: hypothetical protein F6K35_47370, partial [Okeania sp. SIO2H7]|nr:hypothetical protein [Okeania sp. SIO2H7]